MGRGHARTRRTGVAPDQVWTRCGPGVRSAHGKQGVDLSGSVEAIDDAALAALGLPVELREWCIKGNVWTRLRVGGLLERGLQRPARHTGLAHDQGRKD